MSKVVVESLRDVLIIRWPRLLVIELKIERKAYYIKFCIDQHWIMCHFQKCVGRIGIQAGFISEIVEPRKHILCLAVVYREAVGEEDYSVEGVKYLRRRLMNRGDH